MTTSTNTSSISFTAHYTGYTWYKNRLAPDYMTTSKGRLLYYAMRPVEFLLKRFMGGTLETYLLQRHLLIDALVEESIAQYQASDIQILELASGLSPRSIRLKTKYPQLHYIDADLPNMAHQKRQILTAQQLLTNSYQVLDCNILEQDTNNSIENVLSHFDTSKPVIVITEGLTLYFEDETIHPVWQRLSKALSAFPQAHYITDNYPNIPTHPVYKIGKFLTNNLSLVTKSKVTLRFANDNETEQCFQSLGFSKVSTYKPEEHYDNYRLPKSESESIVHIIDCQV